MTGLGAAVDRMLRTLFQVAPWAQLKAEPPRAWWEKLLPFQWRKRPQPQVSPLPAPPAVTTPEPAPVAEPAARVDYSADWRKYFNDVYTQLQRKPLPPPPELPMPARPPDTDWQKLLTLLVGAVAARSSVGEGMLQSLAQRYADEQRAQQEYIRALAERAYKQAEMMRQHQMLQEQQEAQAREDALKLAMSLATDEERRQLQAQLEALRNQRALEVAKMQNDMQAVSRHMAIVNNPNLPAEQRAAAYQNAAAILSQYGYELPALPSMPSVAERQQVLREQMEPQRMQLQRERFDLERWRSQQQVKQGWKRIELAQQGIALNAQRLAQSVAKQNWQQAQDAIKNISIYQSQLAKEEDSITRQLNAHTKDELGRPVPLYNIPLHRQQELLAGATPTSPLEAQWQDLKMRLATVRRERQRAAQLLQKAVLPPAPAASPPATGKPVFKTRSGNTFTP